MADDNKKGPVKPPIIDATPVAAKTAPAAASKARVPSGKKPQHADAAQTARDAPKSTSSAKPKAETAKKPSDGAAPKNSQPLMAILVSTILGASIGVGVTSFMAFNHIAPFQKSVSTSQLNAALEGVNARLTQLENAPAPDTSQFATQAQLENLNPANALEEFSKRLDGLTTRLDEAPASQPAPAQNQTIDLTALKNLQAEIDGLKATLVELSPQNSTSLEAQITLNEKMVQLATDIDALKSDQGKNAQAITTLDGRLNALASDLDVTTAKIEARNPDEDAAKANLPLLLEGWQRAQNSGAPFIRFVKGAENYLPGLVVSKDLKQAAETGITPLSDLRGKFGLLLPEMIKLHNQLPDDAPWQDQIFAQAKSAIGLRPLDQQGDDPMAIIARLEAALESGNATIAANEYKNLPDEMKAGTVEFGAKILLLAEAENALSAAQKLSLDLAISAGETAQ